MKKAVILCAAAALGGCSLWNSWFDRERTVEVTELQRLQSCGSQGPLPRVDYFYDAESVQAWEQERGVRLTDLDPRIDGPFALIEVGERGLEGYGVLVSHDAVVHGDGRLVLRSTFFYAAQISGRPAQASPCVLLALPPRRYGLIELYDQEGVLQAQTSTKREKK